ncbi:MAG: hypothetical protein ACJA08_001253 [Cyclobacteriaceae bacterium]|jgi:hypothetical protein
MKNYIQVVIAIALISLAVLSRTILHIPNFAAIAAVGLFSGFYFRGKLAYIIPLAAVLISDYIIGFYDLGTMSFVYAAWMLPVLIGKWKLSFNGLNKIFDKILSVGAKAIIASVSFYLISNLGVWLFGGMYTMTFSGLIECYTLAIPFFRYTLVGDLLFSGLLFGSFYLVANLTANKKQIQPEYIRK